jgi:hypothetical protein
MNGFLRAIWSVMLYDLTVGWGWWGWVYWNDWSVGVERWGGSFSMEICAGPVSFSVAGNVPYDGSDLDENEPW